ncbi:general stress protein [Subtercola sp. YIM 133946]|uniref:general stress protein n=1 Tax=Subtercola sp. YIM 133946 TaxID=3118909 RepID=UPI002F945131
MTNQMPGGGRGSRQPARMPRGDVVMTYETYEEAQADVDALAKADFPVGRLTIVGSGLKTIEVVTGKLSYGRGALAGAFSGAWLGLFIGLLLVIFSPTATSVEFVVAAVLIGAGFGVLFGIVSYALNRRRRDFTSNIQVIATSYQIIADPEVANRARNLIAPGSTWGATSGAPTGFTPPPPPTHPSDPPPPPAPPHPSDPPPPPAHPSDPPPPPAPPSPPPTP